MNQRKESKEGIEDRHRRKDLEEGLPKEGLTVRLSVQIEIQERNR
jgi:hypothetical protein